MRRAKSQGPTHSGHAQGQGGPSAAGQQDTPPPQPAAAEPQPSVSTGLFGSGGGSLHVGGGGGLFGAGIPLPLASPLPEPTFAPIAEVSGDDDESNSGDSDLHRSFAAAAAQSLRGQRGGGGGGGGPPRKGGKGGKDPTMAGLDAQQQNPNHYYHQSQQQTEQQQRDKQQQHALPPQAAAQMALLREKEEREREADPRLMDRDAKRMAMGLLVPCVEVVSGILLDRFVEFDVGTVVLRSLVDARTAGGVLSVISAPRPLSPPPPPSAITGASGRGAHVSTPPPAGASHAGAAAAHPPPRFGRVSIVHYEDCNFYHLSVDGVSKALISPTTVHLAAMPDVERVTSQASAALATAATKAKARAAALASVAASTAAAVAAGGGANSNNNNSSIPNTASHSQFAAQMAAAAAAPSPTIPHPITTAFLYAERDDIRARLAAMDPAHAAQLNWHGAGHLHQQHSASTADGQHTMVDGFLIPSSAGGDGSGRVASGGIGGGLSALYAHADSLEALVSLSPLHSRLVTPQTAVAEIEARFASLLAFAFGLDGFTRVPTLRSVVRLPLSTSRYVAALAAERRAALTAEFEAQRRRQRSPSRQRLIGANSGGRATESSYEDQGGHGNDRGGESPTRVPASFYETLLSRGIQQYRGGSADTAKKGGGGDGLHTDAHRRAPADALMDAAFAADKQLKQFNDINDGDDVNNRRGGLDDGDGRRRGDDHRELLHAAHVPPLQFAADALCLMVRQRRPHAAIAAEGRRLETLIASFAVGRSFDSAAQLVPVTLGLLEALLDESVGPAVAGILGGLVVAAIDRVANTAAALQPNANSNGSIPSFSQQAAADGSDSLPSFTIVFSGVRQQLASIAIAVLRRHVIGDAYEDATRHLLRAAERHQRGRDAPVAPIASSSSSWENAFELAEVARGASETVLSQWLPSPFDSSAANAGVVGGSSGAVSADVSATSAQVPVVLPAVTRDQIAYANSTGLPLATAMHLYAVGAPLTSASANGATAVMGGQQAWTAAAAGFASVSGQAPQPPPAPTVSSSVTASLPSLIAAGKAEYMAMLLGGSGGGGVYGCVAAVLGLVTDLDVAAALSSDAHFPNDCNDNVALLTAGAAPNAERCDRSGYVGHSSGYTMVVCHAVRAVRSELCRCFPQIPIACEEVGDVASLLLFKARGMRGATYGGGGKHSKRGSNSISGNGNSVWDAANGASSFFDDGVDDGDANGVPQERPDELLEALLSEPFVPKRSAMARSKNNFPSKGFKKAGNSHGGGSGGVGEGLSTALDPSDLAALCGAAQRLWPAILTATAIGSRLLNDSTCWATPILTPFENLLFGALHSDLLELVVRGCHLLWCLPPRIAGPMLCEAMPEFTSVLRRSAASWFAMIGPSEETSEARSQLARAATALLITKSIPRRGDVHRYLGRNKGGGSGGGVSGNVEGSNVAESDEDSDDDPLPPPATAFSGTDHLQRAPIDWVVRAVSVAGPIAEPAILLEMHLFYCASIFWLDPAWWARSAPPQEAGNSGSGRQKGQAKREGVVGTGEGSSLFGAKEGGGGDQSAASSAIVETWSVVYEAIANVASLMPSPSPALLLWESVARAARAYAGLQRHSGRPNERVYLAVRSYEALCRQRQQAGLVVERSAGIRFLSSPNDDALSTAGGVGAAVGGGGAVLSSSSSSKRGGGARARRDGGDAFGGTALDADRRSALAGARKEIGASAQASVEVAPIALLSDAPDGWESYDGFFNGTPAVAVSRAAREAVLMEEVLPCLVYFLDWVGLEIISRRPQSAAEGCAMLAEQLAYVGAPALATNALSQLAVTILTRCPSTSLAGSLGGGGFLSSLAAAGGRGGGSFANMLLPSLSSAPPIPAALRSSEVIDARAVLRAMGSHFEGAMFRRIDVASASAATPLMGADDPFSPFNPSDAEGHHQHVNAGHNKSATVVNMLPYLGGGEGRGAAMQNSSRFGRYEVAATERSPTGSPLRRGGSVKTGGGGSPLRGVDGGHRSSSFGGSGDPPMGLVADGSGASFGGNDGAPAAAAQQWPEFRQVSRLNRSGPSPHTIRLLSSAATSNVNSRGTTPNRRRSSATAHQQQPASAGGVSGNARRIDVLDFIAKAYS